MHARPDLAAPLRLLSARKFDEYFSQPKIRIKVAGLLLDPNLDVASIPLEAQIFSSAQTSGWGSGLPTFIPPDWLSSSIVDPDVVELESDSRAVEIKWREGMTLIARVAPGRLLEIARCADLICGLRGDSNTIQAFSNSNIPGFIAFNVTTPPVLAAEQILHEATHSVLSATLALDKRYAQLVQPHRAAFSPFTDSVRPVERVVHGVISYAAVLEFWKQLTKTLDAPTLHDSFGGQSNVEEIISRRIMELDARVRVAVLFLRDALEPDEFSALEHLVADLLPDANRLLYGAKERELTLESAGYSIRPSGLSAIQRAEVLLAHSGKKVSRVSFAVSTMTRFGFALAAESPVVPASWVISPVFDSRLGGFSNVVRVEKPILQAAGDDLLHLYVARSAYLAREAAQLDRKGEAGAHFGIPACCRAWFAKRWYACAEQGGDLFALLLREWASNGRVVVHEECDASAMFRGGGLCWHFPCEPDCGATVTVVRERKAFLADRAPELLSELSKAHLKWFWLDHEGRYLTDEATAVRSGHIMVQII